MQLLAARSPVLSECVKGSVCGIRRQADDAQNEPRKCKGETNE
jgi:hypothetical protein